ncbi:MAG: Ig-like domain-containing protein [Bacteroidota bacterium]
MIVIAHQPQYLRFSPVAASTVTSTISASATTLVADGLSVSTITVQLKDASGVNLITSGGTIIITTTAGNH